MLIVLIVQTKPGQRRISGHTFLQTWSYFSCKIMISRLFILIFRAASARENYFQRKYEDLQNTSRKLWFFNLKDQKMSDFDENWIWPYQNEAQDLRNSIFTTKISQIPKNLPKIALKALKCSKKQSGKLHRPSIISFLKVL